MALMVVFQASAVVTLGFSQDSSDCECDGGSWVQDDMRCQESGRIASRTRIRPTGIADFQIENEPLDPQHCCPRTGIIIGVEIKT